MESLIRLKVFFLGAGAPILITLGLCTAILIGCLASIAFFHNERATLFGGMLLIATGLIAPLFLPELSTNYDKRQDDFMKNTFLLFAGVGGNLVAASVLLKKEVQACSCGSGPRSTHDAPLTSPAPTPTNNSSSQVDTGSTN